MESCPSCQRWWRGTEVLISFRRCDCPGASAGGGHYATLCRWCGFEAWAGCQIADGQQVDLPRSLWLRG